MTGFLSAPTRDPLDLEIEPGFKVRDLRTPEECASALSKLDMDIESILGQIARSEASPDDTERGWRTRAQGAIRWKKRVKSAIQNYKPTLVPPRPANTERRQAILDTIRDEIGEDEMQRFIGLAKVRNPELWGGAA